MTARELYALALDEKRPLVERLTARDELLAKAKAAKKSVPKLINLLEDGIKRWNEVLALEYDPLDETIPDSVSHHEISLEEIDPKLAEEVAKVKEAEKPKKKGGVAVENGPKTERGLISAMVRQLLLDTDLPYGEIVDAVRAKHPKAVTTNRSVASVASELRSMDQKVPERRKVPKA